MVNLLRFLMVADTTGSGTLQFAGMERDLAAVGGSADLPDYDHQRFYDLNDGRFLSVDPQKDWNLRSPQSWNSYVYARNNPLLYVDDSGGAAVKIFVKIFSAALWRDAWREVTRDVAVRMAARGEEHAVKVVGPGASREARSIVREAFPGEEIIRHDAHPGPGNRGPHWQPKRKLDGQVNYELGVFIAGLIPVVGWIADAEEVKADASPSVDARSNALYGQDFYNLSEQQRRDVASSLRDSERERRKPAPKKDPKGCNTPGKCADSQKDWD